MNEMRERLAALSDENIPELGVMLGAEAGDMLTAAVAIGGGEVASARPASVTWRPGRSLTVSYDATVNWPGAAEATTEVLVAMAGERLPKEALLLEHDGLLVGVWRLPFDPALPGLASLLDPHRAGGVLAQVGVTGPVTTRLRAYRPGRRAVVEVGTNRGRVFAKLVRPRTVRALQRRHELLADAVNAPRSLGWSEEHGLVLLEALDGATLRTALSAPHAKLPSPGEVIGLVRQLPAMSDGRKVGGPLRDAAGHARLLSRVVPEATGRIKRLVEAFEAMPAEGPLVTVHGDLYEDQVMVKDGRLTGILDLDTVGLGQRADDLATFIAHLAVWGPASPQPERVREYARQLLAIADASEDPAGVRRRVSAAVLGLATGPFRVQSRNWPAETLGRITLAERWNESADRIAAGLAGRAATPVGA